MFPRPKRLSRTDFGPALAGRRISSTHLSIVVPHHGVGYAVVVSKKIARLSTTRHLLKRRILAILGGLTLPPALVVFPKSGAIGLTFAELKEELSGLTKRISG